MNLASSDAIKTGRVRSWTRSAGFSLSGWILKWAPLCIFAVFAWLFFTVLLVPKATASPKSLTLAVALAVAFAVALPCLLPVVRGPISRAWAGFRLLRIAVPILAFVLLFVAELLIGRSVYTSATGWDPDWISKTAQTMATTGSVPASLAGYFAVYPTNVVSAAFLGDLFTVARQMGVHDLVAVRLVLNACLLTATVGVTTILARRITGRRGAVIAFLITSALIGLSPWVAVIYTDTLGILFPVLSLLLIHCLWYSRTTFSRVMFAVTLGLTIGVGSRIKPTIIIATLAVIIVLALLLMRRAVRWNLIVPIVSTIVIAAVVAIGVRSTIFPAAEHAVESSLNSYQIENARTPIDYWFLTGLHHTTADEAAFESWGSWDPEDAGLMEKFGNPADRSDAARKVIVERLEAMGPSGYASFLSNKATWTLSDGTFGTFFDGYGGSVKFYFSDDLSHALRPFFHSQRNGLSFGTLAQALWLLILASIASQILPRFRTRKTWMGLAIIITIAGALLYTELFEARARYLFNFAPIFILAAIPPMLSFTQLPFSRKSMVEGRRTSSTETAAPKHGNADSALAEPSLSYTVD